MLIKLELACQPGDFDDLPEEITGEIDNNVIKNIHAAKEILNSCAYMQFIAINVEGCMCLSSATLKEIEEKFGAIGTEYIYVSESGAAWVIRNKYDCTISTEYNIEGF